MNIYSQKYYTKYNQIVKHYKELNLKKTKEFYTENHHIVPRSMGGNNSKDNLVRIPARVHFLLHWMLYRIYKTPSMALAWHSMCMDKFKNRYTSKSYAYARNAIVSMLTGRKLSESHKNNIGKAMIGRIVSVETGKKISLSKIGKLRDDITKQKLSISHTGKILSDSHKENISKSHKGKLKSPEHRRNISNGKKGKPMSDIAKYNMSSHRKSLPIITCPHCNKSGRGNRMVAYHWDKCKFKGQLQIS